MKCSYLNRRAFLRASGLSGAFLPLLNVGRAEAAAFPKRLIVVMQTEGTIESLFWPQGTGNSLANLTLPFISSPLEKHKADLIFVDGVEMRNFTDPGDFGAGHENFACSLSGVRGVEVPDPVGRRMVSGGPSIDQVVADGVATQVTLPFRSLALATQVGGGIEFLSRCFYRAAQQPIAGEEDPRVAFTALFAGRAVTGTMIDTAMLERKSVLDYVGRSLDQYSKTLGTDDRLRIGGHLEAIQDLEARLTTAGTAAACVQPAQPVFATIAGSGIYPNLLSTQFDLAVAALRCDLTRVVTVQLHNSSATALQFPFVPSIMGTNVTFDPGGARNYHDLAHNPGTSGMEKAKADQWFMQQFAALIDRLKAIPEGTGTMFDNTVIFWANHMGNGGAHSSTRLPWILAGRCGGYFNSGTYLRATGNKGVPTNQVLVSLANAMDVPMANFGDPMYGGELQGLHV